jgi:hypothetical protein
MRNKTITVDLESWSSSPTVLGNTTNGIYPLQPYQQALWDRLSQGGFKQGQMPLYYSAVQHTGKSLYQKMVLNKLYGTNLCNEILLPMKPAPKYKFSRAKWYEVHLFSKSWDPVQERLDWCEQQFGPQPKKADAWTRWYTSFTTLRFRDQEDYMMFVLRWGRHD